MTKSALTTALDTALSIVITKAKVLASLANLVDTTYPTIISETNSTTEVLTSAGVTGWTYSLKIWKQGRTVFISGTVTSDGTATSSQVLMNITNTEYVAPAFNFSSIIEDNTEVGKTRLRVNGSEIYIGSISFNGTLNVAMSYPAVA